MIELKIEKMYDDVIMPDYKNEGDSGFDIHSYLYDEAEKEPVKSIKIYPKSSAKIHTGLKFQIPEGYYIELHMRSSAGVKLNLDLKNTVGIIDEKYSEEVLVFVRNYGNEPVEIMNGERIVQGVLKKREQAKIVQVYKVEETERGEGFGSSGRM